MSDSAEISPAIWLVLTDAEKTALWHHLDGGERSALMHALWDEIGMPHAHAAHHDLQRDAQR